MKYILRYGIWLILFLGIVANIAIFVWGMGLGNEINFFEQETKRLHLQNIELDKKISYYQSLQFAASTAAVLDFTKKGTPVYLENLKYAKN